jgi:hypothetical protein
MEYLLYIYILYYEESLGKVDGRSGFPRRRILFVQ